MPKDRGRFHDKDVTFFPGKSRRDDNAPQINKKIISGPDAGTHTYYVPKTGREGYVGPQADRNPPPPPKK